MSMLSKNLRRARLNLDPRLRVVRVANDNSLCGVKRLTRLRAVAQRAAERGPKGAFVECGTFRGGSAAVISDRLVRSNADLEVYLFDVFTGMPEPGPNDPREAWEDVGKFVSSPQIVRRTFELARVPVAPGKLNIVQGLYEQTLPGFRSPEISFLHVDCDWYDSVKLVVETFYNRVLPGGTVVFDDYGFWSGCRKFVDEFIAARGLRVILTPIDSTSHYFVNPP